MPKNNGKIIITEDDVDHEFFHLEKYNQFADMLPSIQSGKNYHFVSFGQFALKFVVMHLIKLVGKCEVCSTTYGLGPTAARAIVDAKQKGLITEFFFLYDHKIKQYKEEAHYLCSSNFPVKVVSIHAKIVTILNNDFGVTISGSANWSDNNPKIETITISTNRGLAEFHSGWIKKCIQSNSVEPKQLLHEIIN